MLRAFAVMEDKEEVTETKMEGRRITFMSVLLLVLIGVTVVIIQMIQRAGVAEGPGGAGSGEMPPAAVYVESLEQEVAQNTAVVTGTLKAPQRADVAARESGAVVEVLADEARMVRRGDVLVKVDDRRIAAQKAETEAQLTSATTLVKQRQTELSRARVDLGMKEKLLGKKAISESDFLDAELRVQVAEAQLQSARDMVAEAESRIAFLDAQVADLSITAPFDGVILRRHVEKGEWVSAGTVVMSMTSLDPVEAWLSVPARYLGGSEAAKKGLKVRQSSTGAIFSPSDVELVPDVNPLSQLYTVLATIPNKERMLVPGESVTGILPVEAMRPYWKVSVNSVVNTRSGDVIYLVGSTERSRADGDEGGMPPAVQVQVQVAFQRNGYSYVSTASDLLVEGAQVVSEGNDRLRPGQPLMIQQAAQSATPQQP